MSNANSEFYNEYISTHFDKFNLAPSIKNTNYLDHLVGEALPKDKDAQMLEIGVGMGHFAFYATQIRKFSNYHGIDISPQCVDYVRKNVTKNAELCKTVVEYLKARPERYDFIVMTDVIEHVRKTEQLDYLKAVYGSLKKGGGFFLTTENGAGLTGYYQHIMDYTHEYNFSPQGLEQILRVAGLGDVKVFGEKIRISGIRSLARYLILKIWSFALKLIYEIERPGSINPTFFTKSIYAICRK